MTKKGGKNHRIQSRSTKEGEQSDVILFKWVDTKELTIEEYRRGSAQLRVLRSRRKIAKGLLESKLPGMHRARYGKKDRGRLQPSFYTDCGIQIIG